MNKKIIIIILVIAGLNFFFLTSCKNEKKESTKTKLGLVFDVGGRGDKSFNDAAYKGLERAKNELGIDFEVIDPGDGSDRESALRILAQKNDIGLIFGVGFIFSDDITNIAKEFPDKKFVCIDYTVNPNKPIPPNLLAITFKEEEGSFLVGVIAGLITKTKTVGFVGGMQSSLIKKFEIGYTEGVKYVCKECNVLSAYVGVTGEGFKNAPKAKEIALAQYNNDADIIFHASGLSGIGVFEAARETKNFAIGVDMNQWAEAPGFVLTSMTKQVDEMILLAAKDFINGNFKSEIKSIGLKEKGVDYVYDENNKNLIPENVRNKVEEIRNKIINNEIVIPLK